MSTRSSFTLVGNATLDETYYVDCWPNRATSNAFHGKKTSIGGIGNMIEVWALENRRLLPPIVINPEKATLLPRVVINVGKDQEGDAIKAYLSRNGVESDIRVCDKPTTKAVIFSEKWMVERTSFVDWGCGALPVRGPFASTSWAHVAYLDVAIGSDIEDLRKSCEVLSADVCLSDPSTSAKEWVIRCLPLLDYLFVSDSEVAPYEGQFGNLKRTKVIHHSREATRVHLTDTLGPRHFDVFNPTTITYGIDVTGAGDAYCMGFILAALEQPGPLEGTIVKAHEQSKRYLMRDS